MSAGALLKIENLTIEANNPFKRLLLVENLQLNAGEIHAVIGESGSGKSLLLKTVLGLLPKGLTSQGKCLLQNESLENIDWLRIRGKHIGMVFQEPMSALNPHMTCLAQLKESWQIHAPSSEKNSLDTIYARLEAVGLGFLKDRLSRTYPHELSGGQRQRLMIAMATLHKPELILADEPTTALDFFSREAVMRDLIKIAQEMGSAVLWVSHELDLVRKFAHRITVMKRGEVLQQGDISEVFLNPVPYLEELVEANPKEKELKATEGEIYLEVKNLKKSYLTRGGNSTTRVLALDGFSVALSQRQTLAIIGTSGSGKSTFAKLLVGLEKPDSGEVWLNGQPLKLQPPTGVQMVFQDPLASLNLRQSAKQAMIEILKFKHPQKRKEEYEQIAVELLRKVGFDDRLIEARPRQMSGGQRQRLCIAKALATEPKVLILDEAVAALDPLIQKQILDLLKEIQQSEGLIYLFITHNLDVARSMADVSIYLNEGKMAEIPESWSV